MENKSIAFLQNLLMSNSPSGFEEQASKIYVDYIAPYCDVSVDMLYNSVAVINPKAETKILIDAHIDEIGMQITYIHEDGFIYFRKVGGIDPTIIPGTEVVILGGKGDVAGIIGKKPIHIQRAEDYRTPLRLDDLCIDIGADSKNKAKELVSVGDYITIKPNMQMLNEHKIVSKALDDKIGVFVVAEVMKQLSKENLNIGVYGVASSQEEVGSKGIKIQVNKIKPQYSICIDVGFASDVYNMKTKDISRFLLGGGVGINHSTDTNIAFTRRIKEIAIKDNIPFQSIVPISPTGGTNTSAIQLSNDGVITSLMSIPCRYIHTPVEMCDMRDVVSAIELIKNVVLEINKSNSIT